MATLAAVARETPNWGGPTVTPPVLRDRPDLDMTVTDAEPIAALQASLAVGHALRRMACEYVRRAREDGRTWPDIAVALGLDSGAGDGRHGSRNVTSSQNHGHA